MKKNTEGSNKTLIISISGETAKRYRIHDDSKNDDTTLLKGEVE